MRINKKLSRLCSVLVLTAALPAWADEDCEATVDMADSLDFHKMHVECAQDPITIYDPKSNEAFPGEKKAAVTTYKTEAKSEPEVVESAGASTPEKTAVPMAAETAPVAAKETAATRNEGVIFNIREPFSISAGPHSALVGLYTQMARHCPQGWKKLEEWVEPAQSGYFLHYQFQCAQ